MLSKRRYVCLLVVIWLCAVSALPAHQISAVAQPDASPAADADESLFTADGVTAPILARTDIDDLSIEEPRLILERIDLPSDANLAVHAATEAELIVVEEGELSIDDSFGFGSSVEAGESITINAAAEYTIANHSEQPATALRIKLDPGADGVAPAESGTTADVSATPLASPIAAEGQVSVLLDQEIDEVPFEPVTLFVARATFEPEQPAASSSTKALSVYTSSKARLAS